MKAEDLTEEQPSQSLSVSLSLAEPPPILSISVYLCLSVSMHDFFSIQPLKVNCRHPDTLPLILQHEQKHLDCSSRWAHGD